jgi:hypothetical protein
MKAKKLILALAVAAIAAPVANAGTDSGIGIPAGRDSALPAAPLVSEKTAGLFRAPQPSPLVSEKTAGLFRAPQPSPLVSEKTAGLWQGPARVSSPPVLASAESGFDWGDAGIGAGVALASLLAASAGGVAIRRRGVLAH